MRLGKISRYRVTYKNRKGTRVSRVIKATHGDNAFLVAKRTYGGTAIKVNKLRG